jgi:hypothetical protein
MIDGGIDARVLYTNDLQKIDAELVEEYHAKYTAFLLYFVCARPVLTP